MSLAIAALGDRDTANLTHREIDATITLARGHAGPRHLRRLPARGARVRARHAAGLAGVEAFELPDHPFYLATLFQPQVATSERGVLHPLVGALLEAAARRAPMLSQ